MKGGGSVKSKANIRIECEVKNTLSLETLEIFQGGLKKRRADDYRKIRDSILKHGIVVPLFIWKDKGHNHVIDGTGRVEALSQMKDAGYSIPELPVVFIKARDEAEAKEILLKIASHYGKVSQTGFEEFIKGLDIDFDDLGLDILPPRDIREELGLIPEAPEKAKTRPGDIYTIGPHRLICGDSTDPDTYRRLMGGEKADLVFTDPPYGVGIGDKNRLLNNKAKGKRFSIEENIENDTLDAEDLQNLLETAFMVMAAYMKESAAFYITAPQGENGLMIMQALIKGGLPVRHQLIWCKNAPTFSMGRLDYDYQHEPILYGWKKTHNFYGLGKYTTSLWHYNKPNKDNLHPTMKPPELIKNAIGNSMEPLDKAEAAIQNGSVKNDIILDVFAGSGSTLMAAQDCKRRSRLIELDPHYCDVIVQRALQAFPKLKARRTRKGKEIEVNAGDFPEGK
jgi:DNA modification methylase